MDALILYLRHRLATRPSCIVFESVLERVWPRSSPARAEKRYAEIQDFAQAHGWSAKIHDPGIRVTFRKLLGATANGKGGKLPKSDPNQQAARAVWKINRGAPVRSEDFGSEDLKRKYRVAKERVKKPTNGDDAPRS